MASLFLIYDERAMYDEDRATVFCSAETIEEAREDARDFAPCVIFEYTKKQDILVDGQLVEYVA